MNRISFSETKMLDLFGGTGNHSYEFISRGCTDVTYVDKFPGCVAFVKKTAAELEIKEYIRVVRSDVFRFIRDTGESYDYIFAGPPYPLPNLDSIPNEVFSHRLLNPGGMFVMEHNPNHDFKRHPNYLEERHYGKTIFSIFVNPEDLPA
jgi:16S rRNA G966 N2-methylase RsmD